MTTKHSGIRRVVLLAAGLAALGAACGSTGSSRTVDSGQDTGPTVFDATRPQGNDAGDATLPVPDGMSIFGDDASEPDGTTGDDADVDGSTDGGADAPDASGDAPAEAAPKDAPAEAAPKEGGAAETGTPDSGACGVMIPTGTSGDGVCTPVTGMCGPGNVSGFVPTPPPPAPLHQNKCATGEVQKIYDGCLGPSSSNAACTAADMTGSCYDCIFTDATATAWGPLIAANGLVDLNYGGCLEQLEPCNKVCATTFEDDVQCERAACLANCPVTDSASVTAYENCANAIDTCAPNGCATYNVGTECSQNITGPGATCFANAGNFELQFVTIATLFCGN